MEYQKINGNTNVILGPTNIGVYTFKNKNCILIDTGTGKSFAKRIDLLLEERDLKPKYIINTHHHEDHTGGNGYFIEKYPGLIINTSSACKVFVENPMLAPILLYGANPVRALVHKGLSTEVHRVLEEEIEKFNDEKFKIVKLNGHCPGQIAIVTPDKVCFLGDSIFSKETIEKYKIPYLFDIAESIESLKVIKTMDADYFVISHCNYIINKEDMNELVDLNLNNIETFKNQILEILDSPTTREEILENLSLFNGFDMGFKQYHLNNSTIGSFLTYLHNDKLIDYYVENGKLYYYR